MNGIANERLGQSLQAFEQAFSDFSSRGRVWKTGEKTVKQCVRLLQKFYLCCRVTKRCGFIPHVLMERRSMSGQSVNYYRRH